MRVLPRGRYSDTVELQLTVAAGTLAVCGVGMILSSLVGAASGDTEPLALLLPGVVGVVVGGAVVKVQPRPVNRGVKPVAGLAAVTLAWVVAAVFGSLPFLIGGVFNSPLDAIFETMSGFTTTGATLIDEIEATPAGLLVWRSATQWLGGVGFVVLIVALAPAIAAGLQKFFYAEASGFSDSRITPRITDTAKIVGGIYLILTAMSALAFFFAGMGPFDAFNHAMTTLATGGFSTRTASLGAFDSVPIETVAIIFMAAGSVNFALYWQLVRGKAQKPTLAEVRLFFIILGIGSLLLTISQLVTNDAEGAGEAIRQGVFTVVSISSTTGFTTADFDLWGGFAQSTLLVLMMIGGCAGSTAGGIKVIRLVLVSRSAVQELRRQVEPRAVNVLRMGGRVFPPEVKTAMLGFFVVYVGVVVVGVGLLTAFGADEVTAIGGTFATLNVVGPGLADVGAAENYTSLPDESIAVLTALMLIGRLELFTVLALPVAFFDWLRRR